jgi:hypothetical protein
MYVAVFAEDFQLWLYNWRMWVTRDLAVRHEDVCRCVVNFTPRPFNPSGKELLVSIR